MEGIQIDGAVFVPEYQSQVFIVWKDRLFSSPVDMKAAGLKWTKIAENKKLDNTLGGFLSGSNVLFNKNEVTDNILLMYDLNGKELEKVCMA